MATGTRFDFLTACKFNDKETVITWLYERTGCNYYGEPQYPNLEFKNEDGQTPLWVASQHGNTSIVRKLIEHKAAIETESKHRTPIWIATKYGNNSVVKLLINEHANINSSDQHGITPLMLAVMNNNKEIFDVFIEDDETDIDILDSDNKSALVHALEYCHYEIAATLVEIGAKIDNGPISAFWISCEYGPNEVADAIIDNHLSNNLDSNWTDVDGHTILSGAVASMNIDAIKILIDRGANVNTIIPEYASLLFVFFQHASLDDNALYTAILTLLLRSNVDPDITDNEGKTFLHHMSQCHVENMIETLFVYGANINMVDKNGQTPLHYCAKKNHIDNAEPLLLLGADLTIKDLNGETPRCIAARKGKTQILALFDSIPPSQCVCDMQSLLNEIKNKIY